MKEDLGHPMVVDHDLENQSRTRVDLGLFKAPQALDSGKLLFPNLLL